LESLRGGGKSKLRAKNTTKKKNRCVKKTTKPPDGNAGTLEEKVKAKD